ncbi:hypothetical protein [Granulicella sibirica]|uniref:ParB/Sulfiredoxin domain-containing protein n=1 Tax=Granulicella sibirica TaxID=2479048 RepID=A0A4Q0T1P6_9BACT|nr:hypothetical protein [Granulicella sibirica]RXH56722.1 hypothetical protein GRAN_0032 [Granulicella sibirica]
MPNPILDQERVAFLKARETEGKMLLPAWPRPIKELPVVHMEVSWVRFSTLNHRTRAEQLQAIRDSNNPTLFTADPLGPVAQEAQYKILAAQEGFEVLKEDLLARKQQEPAVLTADGILINGNRRSAALRNLYSNKPPHLDARYVKCLVLPDDATPAELLDLEAELQVARDFKEDYSWINEALLIEELYDREGKDYERVGARMHREASAVRQLHEKLQQVHQLVSLSGGARLHIDFKENESAFDELTKHIRNKSKDEADSVRSTYFLGTLSNVNYRRLRHLRRPDAARMVLNEIENDAALSPLLDVAPDAGRVIDLDDPLDAVLGADPRSNRLNDVLGLLATKKREETIDLPRGGTAVVQHLLDTLQSAINAAADEAEEEQKDQTTVTAPVVRTKKAVAELERALSALPRARTLTDWAEGDLDKQLDAVETLLSKLRMTE